MSRLHLSAWPVASFSAAISCSSARRARLSSDYTARSQWTRTGPAASSGLLGLRGHSTAPWRRLGSIPAHHGAVGRTGDPRQRPALPSGSQSTALSAMAGRHTAGKHAAGDDRRTWGRRNSRPRLGNGEDLLWLSPACQCQVACFGHRANGSGMHSGMRAAHRPVEQHRPGTDHAGQRRGGAPSAGAPVTSPARPRRRDPRDGPM